MLNLCFMAHWIQYVTESRKVWDFGRKRATEEQRCSQCINEGIVIWRHLAGQIDGWHNSLVSVFYNFYGNNWAI
jgi:hypothetical protein